MALERVSLQSYCHTVDHYADDSRRGRFTLDAPYQRGTVWTDENRRALIKSLLMGLPIGAVVVNHRGYDSDVIYSVIDGKQRIETLCAFMDGLLEVPADWFDTNCLADPSKEMVAYGDLSLTGQRRFKNLGVTTLQASVSGIAAEAEIYGLINTAGVAQSDADIANAARVAGA